MRRKVATVNEKEPQIRIFTGEKPHECRTARHVDDLAVQVDRLEATLDRFRVEMRKEVSCVRVKTAVLSVGIALILYGLYEKGLLSTILGMY